MESVSPYKTRRLEMSKEFHFITNCKSETDTMTTQTILPVNGHSSPGQSVIVPNSSVIFQHYSPSSDVSQLSRSSIDEMQLPSELSPQSSTTSNGASSPQPCMICGDRATGKHYGAHSCDGCKGFFRRSVRKVYNYTCRFDRSCIVDKDKRNQCRYCRFKKCFQAGMRKEAVQNERDKICHNRHNYEDPANNEPITIKDFMMEGSGTETAETPKPSEAEISSKALATVDDICSSMKQQVLILVEWAKRLPLFNTLVIDNQIALLRGHTAEQLILGVAWRSVPYDNLIVLGNEFIIGRHSPNSATGRIGCRIMDEIVQQFRELSLDATEYVCLKALLFFDPTGVKGLTQIDEIKNVRFRILKMLEDYVNDRHLDTRGRFGRLLLLLPVLGNIAWKMVESIQIEEVIGNTSLDSLLKEMLLGVAPS